LLARDEEKRPGLEEERRAVSVAIADAGMVWQVFPQR
jgi:hypothetical protein